MSTLEKARALVAAMDERGAAWHGHYDALYVEAMDKAADACIALVRGWPQGQAVDDAICPVCDGTREYVQPCPGCAEAKVDGMYPQEMCERMAAPEGEVELLRQDVAAHLATALAENERAEAAEQALHKERMLTDEVVGQLLELGKMYNEQARTIIELQKNNIHPNRL